MTLILLNNTAAAAKSLQSCLTLCDPIDSSPVGSSVPGILQARILEWVAISFSNAWKWKVKVKSLSHVQLFATPWTTAYQAPPSMDFPGQSTGVGCHCLLRKQIYRSLFTYILPKFLSHQFSNHMPSKSLISNRIIGHSHKWACNHTSGHFSFQTK